ncbi:CHAT domain-containing protein [Actinomadura litoris]|uniref:CHAT domain-containing protein n=1 Tax=Actinomadura litoris TaxID=2678616 RepID=UPI001FA79708|nr:CHAT domain-containing protein [Actinomadura litoris]
MDDAARARAAAEARLGSEVRSVEARRALERITADPADWVLVAERVFAGGVAEVGRPAALVVAGLMEFALDATAAQNPLRDQFLQYYSFAFSVLVERLGDVGAMPDAVKVISAEAERHPEGHPVRRFYFYLAERVATVRADLAPSAAAGDALISARLLLVPLMAPDDPETAELMARLGSVFLDRCDGSAADPVLAAEAVRWTRRAIEAAGAEHPRLGVVLGTAAQTLMRRYAGQEAELAEAAELARRAVRWHAREMPGSWQPREDLARILLCLFEVNGDLAVVDEAAEQYALCLAQCPDEAVTRAHVLAGLGNARRLRYQRTGDLGDLQQAVLAVQEARDGMPVDDQHYATVLSNLSALLYYLYERTGSESTHNEAVAAGRAALEVGRSPATLSNLGSSLLQRFVRTRDSRVLDEAADLLARAVAGTPEEDPELPGRLNNLAEAQGYRFFQLGEPAALDESIRLGRRALAALSARPPHDQLRCGVAARLGHRLRMRYASTGDPSAPEEAAGLLREVVAALPETAPDRPHFLSIAATALESLYQETRRPEVLDEAIAVARAGIGSLRHGHGAEQGLLMVLGLLLGHRYDEVGDRAFLREAGTLFRDASLLDGPPTDQIVGCRLAAAAAMREGDWRAASGMLDRAIALLPRLAARGLGRGDQERLLKDIAGLAQDACASALQVGEPERALTLLEGGRGILFAQMLETRSDFTELRDRHPATADRLDGLRDRLAAPPDPLGDPDEHHALARRWDLLIAEIRELPGFARFALPPSAEELLAAAGPGRPVVVVSISEHRSDALLLTADGLDVVALPGVTPAGVEEQVRGFLAAMGEPVATDAERGRQVAHTLTWLWEMIAGPVLDRLDLTGAPSQIWWCPTGPLSLLPLHAASTDAAAVLDRVVSSYTPTVRALLHARRGRGSRGAGAVSSLVVPMPFTSGAQNLPGAAKEAEVLGALFERVTVLAAPDARRGRVLAELPRHEVAHFACHAFSDSDHPSTSHLLLGDHEDRPLTVLDIAGLRLEDAELAYLSACSTARPGGALADEAIHLAAAFQLAGYRSVIGTLWPVADRPAVRFARGVYEAIAAEGTDMAAHALHATTHRLRDRWPGHPEIWAAFIHVGA